MSYRVVSPSCAIHGRSNACDIYNRCSPAHSNATSLAFNARLRSNSSVNSFVRNAHGDGNDAGIDDDDDDDDDDATGVWVTVPMNGDGVDVDGVR
jgi:hypothetical protein